MKKELALIFLTILCLNNSAQIEKGRILVGLSFNYQLNERLQLDTSGNQRTDSRYQWFTSNIRVGYFFANGFMAGIKFTHQLQKGTATFVVNPDYNNSSERKGSSYAPGIFCRYYKMLGKSKFAIFGELGGSYGISEYLDKGNTTSGNVLQKYEYKSSGTRFQIAVNPGITYFATSRIAIESHFGSVGYTINNDDYYTNGKMTESAKTGGFNAGLNFNLANVFLGVNFYFGKRSEDKAVTPQ